jgi:hypothetical protein
VGFPLLVCLSLADSCVILLILECESLFAIVVPSCQLPLEVCIHENYSNLSYFTANLCAK